VAEDLVSVQSLFTKKYVLNLNSGSGFMFDLSSGQQQNEVLVHSVNVHSMGSHIVYNIKYTGLFKMIVGVLTTCHTQYT